MHCFWRHKWFSSAFFSSSEGLAGQVLERADGILLLRAIQQRTRERRRADAHMVRGNDGLEPLAADIDLHGVIREDVAVDVAQADGALGRRR